MIGRASLHCLEIDEKLHSYTGCIAEILHHRDLKGVKEHIIQEACQSHHDSYTCGTKTLHAVIHLWLNAAYKLIDQGIPLSVVCETLYEGVDVCVDHLKVIAVPCLSDPLQITATKSLDKDRPSSNNDLTLNNLTYSGRNQTENQPGTSSSDENNVDDVSWFFDEKTDDDKLRADLTASIHVAMDAISKLSITSIDTDKTSKSLNGTEVAGIKINEKNAEIKNIDVLSDGSEDMFASCDDLSQTLINNQIKKAANSTKTINGLKGEPCLNLYLSDVDLSGIEDEANEFDEFQDCLNEQSESTANDSLTTPDNSGDFNNYEDEFEACFDDDDKKVTPSSGVDGDEDFDDVFQEGVPFKGNYQHRKIHLSGVGSRDLTDSEKPFNDVMDFDFLPSPPSEFKNDPEEKTQSAPIVGEVDNIIQAENTIFSFEMQDSKIIKPENRVVSDSLRDKKEEQHATETTVASSPSSLQQQDSSRIKELIKQKLDAMKPYSPVLVRTSSRHFRTLESSMKSLESFDSQTDRSRAYSNPSFSSVSTIADGQNNKNIKTNLDDFYSLPNKKGQGHVRASSEVSSLTDQEVRKIFTEANSTRTSRSVTPLVSQKSLDKQMDSISLSASSCGSTEHGKAFLEPDLSVLETSSDDSLKSFDTNTDLESVNESLNGSLGTDVNQTVHRAIASEMVSCRNFVVEDLNNSLKFLENRMRYEWKHCMLYFRTQHKTAIEHLIENEKVSMTKFGKSAQAFSDDIVNVYRQTAIDIDDICGVFLDRSTLSRQSRKKVKDCIIVYIDELWEKMTETHQVVDSNIEILCSSLRHIISEHSSKNRKFLDIYLQAVKEKYHDNFRDLKAEVNKLEESSTAKMQETIRTIRKKVKELSQNRKNDFTSSEKLRKCVELIEEKLNDVSSTMSCCITKRFDNMKKSLVDFDDVVQNEMEVISLGMYKSIRNYSDVCLDELREMYRILTMKSHQAHSDTISVVAGNRRILLEKSNEHEKLVQISDLQRNSIIHITNVDSEALKIQWDEIRSSFTVICAKSFHFLQKCLNKHKKTLVEVIKDNERVHLDKYSKSDRKLVKGMTVAYNLLVTDIQEPVNKFKCVDDDAIFCGSSDSGQSSDATSRSGHFHNSHECSATPKLPDVDFDIVVYGHGNANVTDGNDFLNADRHHGEQAFPSNNSTHSREVMQGLSHGNDSIMDVVVSIFEAQRMNRTGKASLDLSSIHCCCLQGPVTVKPRIIEGVVLSTTRDMLAIVDKKPSFNSLLISGDLKPGAKHLGYKESLKSHRVSDKTETLGNGGSWVDTCIDIICKLNVTSLLVQGQVDNDLSLALRAVNVVVIKNVPYKVLQMIAITRSTEITTYITDASKVNVVADVFMRPWRGDWMDVTSSPCIILSYGKSVMTAIFNHPSVAMKEHIEEQFWHCASRLHHVISDGHVLPGCGETERLCAEHLQNIVDKSDERTLKTVVFEAMIEAFQQFSYESRRSSNLTLTPAIPKLVSDDRQLSADGGNLETVDLLVDSLLGRNTNPSSEIRGGSKVFDDPVTKASAWQHAANVVCTLIQTDAEVINGPNNAKIMSKTFQGSL